MCELIENNCNYRIIFKKNKLHFKWLISEKCKHIFFSQNNFEIDIILCHLQVWHKIFYGKHKTDTYEKKYNEKTIFNNLGLRIEENIEKNNYKIIDSENEKKIVIHEILEKNNKEMVYLFVFVKSKENANLYLATMYRIK